MFGHITGVKVGQAFDGRQALHNAGVHRGLMRGIAPEGASIVISGGYVDDMDNGDEIIYTGEGGRDANTGKQIADQTMTGGNAALARNYVDGNPVRVNRLVPSTQKMYRYDGLYRVEEFWSETGRDGFLIWRYKLIRHDGQVPITGPVASHGQAPLQPAGNANPSRATVTTTRIIRSTAIGNEAKRIYKHTCQVCSTRLDTPAGPYAECCHIKPLGKPHNGPDTLENVLCLCPNCHVQFDSYAILIDDNLNILGSKMKLHVDKQHPLNIAFINYHRNMAGGL